MRRRTTLLAGGALALALALGGMVGGVLAESRTLSAPAPAAAPSTFADRALSGAAGGVGASAIATLEEQVRVRPRDPELLTQLGFAHQLRWRETSDPSYLTRSEKALRAAVRFGNEDANAVLGLGSLALIRHQFRDALVYGRRAERLLPGSARPYGVIGDALVELGSYRSGFAAFDRMVSLRPSLGSYSRVAYARELLGDRTGAKWAMRMALDAAAGQPEPSAWALVELSKLESGPGRADRAERLLRRALRLVPGYVPARQELVRIAVARGDLRRGIAEARRAADASPTPHTYDLLAELLDRVGRSREAAKQRAAGGPLDRELVANGVRIELELAVHRSDFRFKPKETLAIAHRARAYQPSIHGDDALGWALARAGQCDEALPYARRALRLGTKNALMFFHRGYTEGCAGNRAAMRTWYARALELDAEFSIRWAPVAREALRNA